MNNPEYPPSPLAGPGQTPPPTVPTSEPQTPSPALFTVLPPVVPELPPLETAADEQEKFSRSPIVWFADSA